MRIKGKRHNGYHEGPGNEVVGPEVVEDRSFKGSHGVSVFY